MFVQCLTFLFIEFLNEISSRDIELCNFCISVFIGYFVTVLYREKTSSMSSSWHVPKYGKKMPIPCISNNDYIYDFNCKDSFDSKVTPKFAWFSIKKTLSEFFWLCQYFFWIFFHNCSWERGMWEVFPHSFFFCRMKTKLCILEKGKVKDEEFLHLVVFSTNFLFRMKHLLTGEDLPDQVRKFVCEFLCFPFFS